MGDLSEGVWIMLFSFKECCVLFWWVINLSETFLAPSSLGFRLC